tara:strand:+ start:5407 stop:6369 length:963 start_codon:yes stop_codon:yes gene_type:complete
MAESKHPMRSTVCINDLQQTSGEGLHKISAHISWEGKVGELEFAWQGESCPNPADALLVLMSSITIPLNIRLSIDVTPSLVGTRLIDYYRRSYSQTSSPPDRALTSTGIRMPGIKPSGEGLLFDGGIDAFHALKQYQDDISTLVFVNGLYGDEDQRQNSQHALRSKLQRIQYQAVELDKALLVLDTNLHDLLLTLGISDTLLAETFYAGLGHILNGNISTLRIPGSKKFQKYEQEEGFEPKLVVHDTGQLTLSEKQARMASDRYLMDALRVCWENPRRSYNCGRCKRCTRRIPARRLLESLRRREAKLLDARRIQITESP